MDHTAIRMIAQEKNIKHKPNTQHCKKADPKGQQNHLQDKQPNRNPKYNLQPIRMNLLAFESQRNNNLFHDPDINLCTLLFPDREYKHPEFRLKPLPVTLQLLNLCLQFSYVYSDSVSLWLNFLLLVVKFGVHLGELPGQVRLLLLELLQLALFLVYACWTGKELNTGSQDF